MAEESSHQWSNLHPDLLECVLKKVQFTDIIRFSSVCSSWFSSAQSFISSPFITTHNYQTPWLITLPTPRRHDKQEQDNGLSKKDCFFSAISIIEKRVYMMKEYKYNDLLCVSRCIGSSYRWLVIIDHNDVLHLLNPYRSSSAHIELPQFAHHEGRILKAVISSDPSKDSNYVVVIIFDLTKLAFYGDKAWTIFTNTNGWNSDMIMSQRDQILYVLDGSNGSIQVWDFHASFPIKRMDIVPSLAPKTYDPDRLYLGIGCLVESMGELLIVQKYFIDDNHEVIIGGEDIVDPSAFCSTVHFNVYKLNRRENKWSSIESLNDRIIFLDRNHAKLISLNTFPELEENSIYFTVKHYRYGIYNTGIYSLKDKSAKPIHQYCSRQLMDGPQILVLPNPW